MKIAFLNKTFQKDKVIINLPGFIKKLKTKQTVKIFKISEHF